VRFILECSRTIKQQPPETQARKKFYQQLCQILLSRRHWQHYLQPWIITCLLLQERLSLLLLLLLSVLLLLLL
jgi:hypothetical protein